MHPGLLPVLTASDFLWAGGVEDTFVPQARAGQRPLDEYELIGHYEHWREDLDLARDLGIRALRWGIPWYRVEPAPGEFDWRWVDEVLSYAANELGLIVIADLVHYGCPAWLPGAFINPEYPRAVAAYAAEFATRYRGLVHWYTPLNEPLMTAEMCGKRGLWPPYLRGFPGYVRVMLQLVNGIIATVNAIRHIDPTAVMVHVEAAGISEAAHADLIPLRDHDELLLYLSYDLLTGRVTPAHPLFPWLLRQGASSHELAGLVQRAIELDVLGLNFYPQWSSHQLHFDPKGRVRSRTTDHAGNGFAGMIRAYQERFEAPVMITETSAFGNDVERGAWLQSSLAAIKDLRADGVLVIGYTWFPLFTMIDWRYRLGRRPLRDYRIELGLYRLQDEGPRWAPTSLAAQYRACVQNSAHVVGPLEPAMPEVETAS